MKKEKGLAPKAAAKIEMAVNLILDESGSMSSVREKTIEGLNEYLGGLRGDPKADYLVTLTKFDAHPGEPTCRVIYKLKPLADLKPMDLPDYEPRGSTPLLDAIGETVRSIGQEVGDRTVLTIIITDGFENASKEFTNDQVKKLIAEKEATGKWTFVYLGADQNAWAHASSLGLSQGNTMSYASAATPQMYSNMAQATMARACQASAGVYATCSLFADAGQSKSDYTAPAPSSVSELARRAGRARADTQTAEERRKLAQLAATARWKNR